MREGESCIAVRDLGVHFWEDRSRGRQILVAITDVFSSIHVDKELSDGILVIGIAGIAGY